MCVMNIMACCGGMSNLRLCHKVSQVAADPVPV